MPSKVEQVMVRGVAQVRDVDGLPGDVETVLLARRQLVSVGVKSNLQRARLEPAFKFRTGRGEYIAARHIKRWR